MALNVPCAELRGGRRVRVPSGAQGRGGRCSDRRRGGGLGPTGALARAFTFVRSES